MVTMANKAGRAETVKQASGRHAIIAVHRKLATSTAPLHSPARCASLNQTQKII
jgi:hypothetical protein